MTKQVVSMRVMDALLTGAKREAEWMHLAPALHF
jgi:hypothetical protein